MTDGSYRMMHYVFALFLFFIYFLCGLYKNRHRKISLFSLFFLFALYALFLGSRNIGIGVDTINYQYWYDSIASNDKVANLTEQSGDLLFNYLMYIVSRFWGFHSFLIIYSIIQFSVLIKIVLLFTDSGKAGSPFLLLLNMMCLFSFLPLHINIIRNGLAIYLMLLFMYYCNNENLLKSAFWGIAALLIHYSLIIPIAVFLFTRLKINIKFFYVVYFCSILLSVFGVGIHNFSVFSGVDSAKIDMYINYVNTDYRIGFRPNFVLYNTFFLMIFLLINSRTEKYMSYLKYYLLSSSVFFLWFYIPYSDRIGLYSWIIIPFIIFVGLKEKYPLKQNVYGGISFMLLYVISIFIVK